jgi:hypothetical protein
MRYAQSTRPLPRHASGDGLLYSAAFVAAVIAITSALYAIDMATVRALLTFP